MDSRGRVDRALFNQRAEAILQHPQFAEAKAIFCRDVPAFWLEQPLKQILIADTGAMAITICIVGFSRLAPEDGALLQMVIDRLSFGNLASANRIRALIDLLVAQGAVRIEPSPRDGRRLKLTPTELLLECHRSWFRSVLPPVSLVFDLPASSNEIGSIPSLAERYITSIMLRQGLDNFTIFDDWPEATAFMDRRHGYLLMLELASAEGPDIAVPRAPLAERFKVSTAHISKLLNEAEERGWLQRERLSSVVHLSPAFSDRLRLWVARELAIVGMWLEVKLAQRA